MPRKIGCLVCDTCRTSVSYWDDNIIGWQISGVEVICPTCQPKKQKDEKQNS